MIDPQGVIRSIQINDDQVGRSVSETIRLIKAFQFAETHKGEVRCTNTCVVSRQSAHMSHVHVSCSGLPGELEARCELGARRVWTVWTPG